MIVVGIPTCIASLLYGLSMEQTLDDITPIMWVFTMLLLASLVGVNLLISLTIPPVRARRAVKVLQKALKRRVLDWGHEGSEYLQ